MILMSEYITMWQSISYGSRPFRAILQKRPIQQSSRPSYSGKWCQLPSGPANICNPPLLKWLHVFFSPQVKGQNNLQGVVGNQTSYASHLPYQETTRNKLLVLNYLSRCSRTALRKLCRRGRGSQVNFTFRNLSDLALNLTKHKAGRM